MAKLLHLGNPLFSRPLKPFLIPFFPNGCCYATQNHSLSSDIRNRALYFLNWCKTSNHLFQIQAYLVTSGLFRDASYSGRILKLSSNLIKDLSCTLLVFKSIDFPDSFCVNTVVKSYSCRNYYKEAVGFYVKMLRDGNFSPNGFTFQPLMSACAKWGDLSLGQMCHSHALKFGVDNVLPVQNSLVHFYVVSGLVNAGCKVFEEMPVKDLVSWNTIIDGFTKVGEMELAHKLFDKMPEKNVVSWNVMITGYLNFRNPGNALKLFREMMGQICESNNTTMVNGIVACGRSNRLKEGRSVHGFLVKEVLSVSVIIDTALVDMYSKCGRADVARVIFDRMSSKNIVSWNAMILGHCIHGNPLDGLRLYTEMVDKVIKFENAVKDDKGDSIRPDELTFIGVLCACVRSGMLTEGMDYFSQMIGVFHLKPNFAHYWCLANLKANMGLNHEAVNLLRNIPIDEDASPEYSIWVGLFGSCRFLGDVALGEQIARDLIEHNPQNFSYYHLLVNLYAVGGRWEEVAKTKHMMKERGIKRAPCSNLKDLRDIVCNIEAGNTFQKDLQTALMK